MINRAKSKQQSLQVLMTTLKLVHNTDCRENVIWLTEKKYLQN